MAELRGWMRHLLWAAAVLLVLSARDHRSLAAAANATHPPMLVSDLSSADGQPLVAVVIVTYRRYELLDRLLQSIMIQRIGERSALKDIEVIVVDNGCLPETREVVERHPSVKYFPQCANIGYSNANNFGAEQASPSVKWLLLLNDDTQLHQGFVHNLLLLWRVFEEGLNRPVGAMGCKMLWPDGRLMEAGSIVYKNGQTINYGRRELADLPQYSYSRTVHYISAACLMVPRSLYSELGGMNAELYEAYFEDTDLAMSIAHTRGLPVVYNPFAVMLHQKHASFGASSSGLKKKSGRVFMSRWSSLLHQYHPAHPSAKDFPGATREDIQRFARDALSATRPTTYRALYVAEANSLEEVAKFLFSVQRTHPVQLTSLFVAQTTAPVVGHAKLLRALQAIGVEVFSGSLESLGAHIVGRKLFLQVVCVVSSNRADGSIMKVMEQHAAELPLFRFVINPQSRAEITQVTDPRPAFLEILPNSGEFAATLQRSSQFAVQSFATHGQNAIAYQIGHAEAIERYLNDLHALVVRDKQNLRQRH